MSKQYSLIGQIFGRLTVIEKTRNEKGVSVWKCLCSCGEFTQVLTASLRSGHTKSCGCLKSDPSEFKRPVGRPSLYNVSEYIGKVFGFWTVIGFSHRDQRSRNQYWICRCRCGVEKPVSSSNLLREISTKCEDCADKESRGSRNALWKGGHVVPGTYLSSLRNSAKTRGIDFAITIDDLEEAWQRQRGKCAYTGEDLTFPKVINANGMNRDEFSASLDRIDSTEGYRPGNIQWVHKYVNLMKMQLSEDIFLLICRLVAKYHPDDSAKTTRRDAMGLTS